MGKLKLYNEDQTLDIGVDNYGKWDSILSSPLFMKKAKDHNDNGGGFVYLRTVDCKGERVPLTTPHMSYSDLKKTLRTQKLNNIFVIFDSVVGKTATLRGGLKKESYSLVAEVGNKILFFGETKKVEESDAAIVKEFIEIEAVLDGKQTTLYFPVTDESWKIERDVVRNDYININAMKVETRFMKGPLIVEKCVYIVMEYSVFRDTYSDVAKVIPNINKFTELSPFLNASTKKPMYSEQLSKIVLFDIFYVKEANPVFNLILFGTGGSGKSSCIMSHGIVFSTDGNYIDMTQTTVAGLVKSYGDGAKPGLLISPVNFTKVVDELFRRSTGDASARGKSDPTSEIRYLLERLMGIVLRDQKGLSGSGKGSLASTEFMRDSFLASDNMIPEVRNAFCSFIKDGGIIRRFCFLRVTDADKVSVQEADIRPSPNELAQIAEEKYESMGFNLHLVRRFAKWFRNVSATISLDGKRSKLKAEEIQREVLKNLWNENNPGQTSLDGDVEFEKFFAVWLTTQNLIPSYEAFVRCCCLARCVEIHKDESLPVPTIEDIDYIEAQELFKRTFVDGVEIYKKGITAWMQEGGVKRTYKG